MRGQYDIDQVFVSAAAAMAFTIEHWAEFEEFVEQSGERVPIDPRIMAGHTRQVLDLIDTKRLPGGPQ